MIKVLDVSFSYGDAPVLEGAELTVERGQVLGVVGPNGAGKTTLLRLVSGFLRPTLGRLLLDGEELERLTSRQIARKTAVVPQEVEAVFPYTVADVVRMGRNPHVGLLQPYGPTDENFVAAALERTGLVSLRDRPFSKLSGGERQRVLVARAIAQRPRLLLMDEPTSHLDLNYQVLTMRLVRTLTTEGAAAICVMHDLTLASLFCDRLAILKSGHVVASGKVEELLTQARIRDVFGVDTQVLAHPGCGRPVVVPVV